MNFLNIKEEKTTQTELKILLKTLVMKLKIKKIGELIKLGKEIQKIL